MANPIRKRTQFSRGQSGVGNLRNVINDSNAKLRKCARKPRAKSAAQQQAARQISASGQKQRQLAGTTGGRGSAAFAAQQSQDIMNRQGLIGEQEKLQRQQHRMQSRALNSQLKTANVARQGARIDQKGRKFALGTKKRKRTQQNQALRAFKRQGRRADPKEFLKKFLFGRNHDKEK